MDAIKQAISSGADVNGFFILNDDRTAVLHWATRYASQIKNLELIKYLVEKCNADIELRSQDGWSPLMEACDEGGVDVVRYLISKGADMNAHNSDGETPLHMAVNRNNEDMLRLLISAKANTEIKDNEGRTPLSLAAEEGKLDAVTTLLEESGADPVAIDNDGQTPGQRADSVGQHRVARKIRRHIINSRMDKLQTMIKDLQQILKEDEENENRF